MATLEELRYLEELEQQPWDSIADVPLDAWYRYTGAVCKGSTPIAFQEWGIAFTTDVYTFQRLYEELEWSCTPKDPNSWHGCNKRYTEERVKNDA